MSSRAYETHILKNTLEIDKLIFQIVMKSQRKKHKATDEEEWSELEGYLLRNIQVLSWMCQFGKPSQAVGYESGAWGEV